MENKKLRGTRLDINGSKFSITPEIHPVFTNTNGALVQKLSNDGNIRFRNILNTLEYKNYIPKRGQTSG